MKVVRLNDSKDKQGTQVRRDVKKPPPSPLLFSGGESEAGNITASVVHVHASDEAVDPIFQVYQESQLKLRFWWPIRVFCFVFSDCARQMWP